MRIAQVAPLAEAVPPKVYGGAERVVSWLTEELVEMGFVSDDDDRHHRRRPSGRSRYDDDDDRRSMRSRDDEGRFTISRSRYNDDDEDDRRGGWEWVSEGDSEAKHRGWEER